MDEDSTLYQRWRAGDRKAGEELYVRHSPSVKSFFRRNIENAQDVEDLLVSTFVALMEYTKPIDNIGGFLYRTAFFKFTHYLRERRRTPESVSEEAFLEEVAGEIVPDPEFVRRSREDLRVLGRAIRRLPLAQQLVVELHYWDGRSGGEIARILGVTEAAVRGRLRLAREGLEVLVQRLAETDAALRTTTTSLEEWRKRMRQEWDAEDSDRP